MSTTLTVTCNRCGHGITAGIPEALAWEKAHDDYCTNPKKKRA